MQSILYFLQELFIRGQVLPVIFSGSNLYLLSDSTLVKTSITYQKKLILNQSPVKTNNIKFILATLKLVDQILICFDTVGFYFKKTWFRNNLVLNNLWNTNYYLCIHLLNQFNFLKENLNYKKLVKKEDHEICIKGRRAGVFIGEKRVGWIGVPSIDILNAYKVPFPVTVFENDV
ncbi:Phenylalanyl-tRNA_synthetase beta chain [Hexamita inflata]|uniref:Phenylalanyl-tRNA synthetase beta chain n=1 Tax=Hexamita inflata TaxID=28002 RepID=A0AA86QJJ8_9EUKA|nr:Phenylalanyl-tRNA synthetase beta chain [Hexamita inflata]